MSYSIPSCTKIVTLTTAPTLFISVGALSVCEFAIVPGVCILLYPRKKRYTLLPEGTDIYTHSAAQSSNELVIWAIFSLRDRQQITFVMLNKFCPLSKLPLNRPPPSPPTPLFLTKKTKLDGIPSKIKWKIHVFWYIVFRVLKLLLIKKYKIELINQFLYLLFYITSAFTWADIIFYNFWEPNATISEKRSPQIFIF